MTPKYKAYLKGEYNEGVPWKVKRKERLEHDNYICQGCGSRAWQVHHDTYERIFHERLSDLKSVCGDCHKEIHGINKVSIFGGIRKVLARVIG